MKHNTRRRFLGIVCWFVVLLTGHADPVNNPLDSLPAESTPDGLSAQDQLRLNETRQAIMQLRGLLEDYYGGPAVLKDTWYLDQENPGFQTGISYLANKFARALIWQDAFVIGTIGSSVTAGYDNCRADNYQEQLTRLMAPIWEAAETDFEVRNTGQGGDCGDSFDNQVWCLPALVGEDVDITHYSWTYFEAGRKNDKALFHELFYRWSLMMNRAPAPQLLYANECAKLSSKDQELLDHYASYGADILCMTRGISRAGYVQPKGREKWGLIGDSLHETTREGEHPDVNPERRQSLGVVYRNWHPGPLLFQTTADALAYRYTTAMLLALEWIGSEAEPHRRWPRKPVRLPVSELPTPLACPKSWCGVPNLPVCAYFQQPAFGKPGVELVSLERPTKLEWPTSGETDVAWIYHEASPIGSRVVPEGEKKLPECAHPQRCSGWIVPAAKQGGWLTFRLTGLNVGLVAMCCGKKRCGQRMLDAGARFLIDGIAPQKPPKALWGGKCVQIQAEFEGGANTVPRTVEVSIRLPKLEKPLPPITHIFGI